MNRRKENKVLILAAVLCMLSGCTAKNDKPEKTVQKVDGTMVTEAAKGTETKKEAAADEQVTEAEKTVSPAKRDLPQEFAVAGWKLTVEDWTENSSLSNVSVELGYTGVKTSEYEKKAAEGRKYVLIKLQAVKEKSKETIKWADLKLTDSAGNEYTRTEDEFINELGMKRMTGNDLNFGTNEGWIAFEVEEQAEGYVLSYNFENEVFEWRA